MEFEPGSRKKFFVKLSSRPKMIPLEVEMRILFSQRPLAISVRVRLCIFIDFFLLSVEHLLRSRLPSPVLVLGDIKKETKDSLDSIRTTVGYISFFFFLPSLLSLSFSSRQFRNFFLDYPTRWPALTTILLSAFPPVSTPAIFRCRLRGRPRRSPSREASTRSGSRGQTSSPTLSSSAARRAGVHTESLSVDGRLFCVLP